MADVPTILSQIVQGDCDAAERLLPLVYDELRRLAAAKLQHEKPGQTLQATALVHEAYLRLLGTNGEQCWDSRGHFFGAAALAMQRILVENARRKKRLKAGGDRKRVDISAVEPRISGPSIDLLALSEALLKLEEKDPRKAELVRLRFFAGLTLAQAAFALGISQSTADNDWAYAKSWLKVEMQKHDLP
ncbi:ECF-type sigma factor [Novipirellula artificiosorum]|uniref:ECF sigma factor n=1 Tax=Novipirellula artificiosorum TaxID=2528016 RepID=A0A5C6DDS4_9BACT|nr:ECF-type sigma factor [Novipirellula artificiosorum]TWU33366.1 ECF sigma factor [Novipirellula artificiosorum]